MEFIMDRLKSLHLQQQEETAQAEARLRGEKIGWNPPVSWSSIAEQHLIIGTAKNAWVHHPAAVCQTRSLDCVCTNSLQSRGKALN
jgi:hypothetical protein